MISLSGLSLDHRILSFVRGTPLLHQLQATGKGEWAAVIVLRARVYALWVEREAILGLSSQPERFVYWFVGLLSIALVVQEGEAYLQGEHDWQCCFSQASHYVCIYGPRRPKPDDRASISQALIDQIPAIAPSNLFACLVVKRKGTVPSV